jgi:hypothetical protein
LLGVNPTFYLTYLLFFFYFIFLVYGCLCRLSKPVEANLRRKKPQLEFWSFALRGAQIEKIWPWQLHGAQVVLRGAQIADFHPWKLRGAQPNLRGALAQFIQKKKKRTFSLP